MFQTDFEHVLDPETTRPLYLDETDRQVIAETILSEIELYNEHGDGHRDQEETNQALRALARYVSPAAVEEYESGERGSRQREDDS